MIDPVGAIDPPPGPKFSLSSCHRGNWTCHFKTPISLKKKNDRNTETPKISTHHRSHNSSALQLIASQQYAKLRRMYLHSSTSSATIRRTRVWRPTNKATNTVEVECLGVLVVLMMGTRAVPVCLDDDGSCNVMV